MTRLTARILEAALALAPERRRSWIGAAASEALSLPEGLRKLRFALSVFGLSVRWRLRQRESLARLGQGMVALALLLICFGGLVFASTREAASVAGPLSTMCLIYGCAGCVAALSLTTLRWAAGIAVVLMAGVWKLGPAVGMDGFVAALCLEAAVGFAVLFVAAGYLHLVGSEEIPA